MVTEEYSCKQVADMFGVSVNEVRKWTHYFNVKKVGNSYKWSKKQADDFYKTTIAPIIIIRSETKKLEHEYNEKKIELFNFRKKLMNERKSLQNIMKECVAVLRE